PISCNPALAGRGPNAIRSIEAPRVHHAARRRGGVAACGARAAASEAANPWVREERLTRFVSSHVARILPGPGRKGHIEGQNVTIETHWAEGPVRPIIRASG